MKKNQKKRESAPASLSEFSYADQELEDMVKHVQERAAKWVRARRCGERWGFKTFDEHYSKDEPKNPPIALIMWYDSEKLMRAIDDKYDSFAREVLDGTPFEAEPWDNVSMHFVPEPGPIQDAFRRYYRFRWSCDLLRAEFSEVHNELFDFFAKHPDRLASVHWRGLEKLLDAVFRNNGFRTLLGPGSGDGGIDLKLFSHDAVGELLTLVQAKRHHAKRPVRVDAVRSFAQVVEDEKANRGLFVTTARYLPSAHRFAESRLTRIELADSMDVSKWCAAAANHLSENRIPSAFHAAVQLHIQMRNSETPEGAESPLVGRILVATKYLRGVHNYFAIVIAETKSGVLAVSLRSKQGQYTAGEETPIVPESLADTPGRNYLSRGEKRPFWAWRREKYFWGNEHLWQLWDGKAVYYDMND
jgi:hypothetical protein